MSKNWPYTVAGISDSQFVRGTVPMTKQDIRALTMSRAKLAPGQTVWDVGAGTGSLTVEVALLTPGGQVFAVEKNEEGLALIGENCRRFGVEHVTVIAGEAPKALVGLPVPNRVIIGGSGGHLAEILDACAEYLLPGGIVIVNVVTIHNLAVALERLSSPPFTDLDGVYLQASRLNKLGKELFFRAENGVYVLSAQKEAQ